MTEHSGRPRNLSSERLASKRHGRRAASALLALSLVACAGPGPSEDSLALTASARAGREVFLKLARPRCSRCHTLRHAGSEGRLGADLDAIRPSRERVLRVVRRGIGLMPSQRDVLTETQMEQVATYVAEVAGSSGKETSEVRVDASP